MANPRLTQLDLASALLDGVHERLLELSGTTENKRLLHAACDVPIRRRRDTPSTLVLGAVKL